jgi:hypothetical protein
LPIELILPFEIAAPVVGWERNLSRDLREYVQPDNVTAIIEQPSICASTKPILLLVIICSSVDNFDARMAIRETWGRFTLFYSIKKKYVVFAILCSKIKVKSWQIF